MVRLSLDKNGSRRFASASTRCKTYVSNARLTLLPDFQRTWPDLNAEPFQSVCARHSEFLLDLARRGTATLAWPMSCFATTPGTKVVGLGGLEPPASPLSGVRSNHLSYRPKMCLYFRWWSLSGSNRRPPACKAGALPAELRPRYHGTRDPLWNHAL